jgi:hypothetical protein
MDATIFDPVQGFAAKVKSNGELHVSASVPDTLEVNVASTTDPLEVTPASAASVGWDQVDVDTTAGGTEIVPQGARRGLLLANLHATVTVYLGFGGAPTPTSGFPLAPGATFALPAGVTTDAQVKGVTAAGTVRVAFVEFV